MYSCQVRYGEFTQTNLENKTHTRSFTLCFFGAITHSPAYTDWQRHTQRQNYSRRTSGWVGANTHHEDHDYGPGISSDSYGVGQFSEDSVASDAGHIVSHWRYSEYAGSVSGSQFFIEEEAGADFVHFDYQCAKDLEEDSRRYRSIDAQGAQDHSDDNKQQHDQHKKMRASE